MTGESESEARFDLLVAEVADGVAQSYRLSPDQAVGWVAPVLAGNRDLCDALAREADPKRLRRMRVYKDAVAAARRAVYFGLRRYRQDEEALRAAIQRLETLAPGAETEACAQAVATIVGAHVSTAERLGHAETAITAIVERIGPAERVIDVGAGVFPLLLPFERMVSLRRYLALDRDEMAMRAVQALSAWRGDDRLTARSWSVADGWAPLDDERFDIALMLKVIPAVQRRDPDHLATLAQVPAERLLVTGSREAMVKRRTIAHRETGALIAFADRFGLAIIDRFETEDEVGLVLARSS